MVTYSIGFGVLGFAAGALGLGFVLKTLSWLERSGFHEEGLCSRARQAPDSSSSRAKEEAKGL